MSLRQTISRARPALRPDRLFLLLGATLVAGYYLLPEEPQLVYYQGFALAGFAAVLAGLRLHRPRVPRAWWLVGLFLLLQIAADTHNNVYELVLDKEAAYPSAADGLYLAGYLALAGAGLLLLRASGKRSVAGLVDSLVVANVAALPLWVFVIEPAAEETGVSTLERVTTMAYPAADALVLAVIARLAIASGSRSPVARLLFLGVVSLLLTDILFGVQEMSNGYVDGGWIDAGWMIAYLLIGSATLHPSVSSWPDRASPPEEDALSLPRLVLLISAGLTVPLVLLSSERLHHLPVSLSGGVVVALLIWRLVLERHRFDELERVTETERRLSEQLRQSQKMEALGRLAGGVAHDFNNLLTAIAGYAELIADQVEPETPLGEDVTQMRKAVARSTAVTRQLLVFNGHQVIVPQRVDVDATVVELAPMHRAMIGARISLDVRPSGTAPHILIDQTHLEQVLTNLVLNARDATEGRGTVTISVTEQDNAEREALVSIVVSDTGSGIADEIRDRIFEPFFTTKPRGAGTGLGLATCYAIVTEAGGTIDAESTWGEGSAFTLTFPQVAAPLTPPAAAQRPRATPPTALPKAGLSVLLAEDEDAVRSFVASTLRRQGYNVVETSNGLQAVAAALAGDHPPDLFLCDVLMPHLNGPEAAAQIRSVFPNLPILFVTGYLDDPAHQSRMLELGATVVAKPFRAVEILAAVRDLTSREPVIDLRTT